MTPLEPPPLTGGTPWRIVRQTVSLTIAYLALTALLIASRGRALSGWPWLVAVHLGACGALIVILRRRRLSGATLVLLEWHPLPLFPVLYKEVELLAPAIGDWRLTEQIPAIEAALFGGQPSIYLSERLAIVPLSEFLHFCYLAYVVVIPAVAAYWYTSGRRRVFHEFMFLLTVVMLGSYLFFILFPVDSPYYRGARLEPPLADHTFITLAHEVASRGGARGGAFPSAHVSGAIVVWLVAWRHQPRLAAVLSPIILGLIVATVYGRFHYAVDTLAGLGFALIVVGVERLARRSECP